MTAPVRGQVYRVDLGFGAKPWLIVSNDRRNRVLSDVLAVRITTTQKHANLPTWVPISPADQPLVGHINVDDVQQFERAELGILLGALAPGTLMRVNEALRIVFALP